ncbi:unnamed protein product [Amoebophrya sp. A25]|nr:unnamed protein product [Amoebophrya sp. A25]|eukprot:GSA25T00008919001.1
MSELRGIVGSSTGEGVCVVPRFNSSAWSPFQLSPEKLSDLSRGADKDEFRIFLAPGDEVAFDFSQTNGREEVAFDFSQTNGRAQSAEASGGSAGQVLRQVLPSVRHSMLI